MTEKSTQDSYKAYISVSFKSNGFTDLTVATTTEAKVLKLFKDVRKELKVTNV